MVPHLRRTASSGPLHLRTRPHPAAGPGEWPCAGQLHISRSSRVGGGLGPTVNRSL